MDDSYLPPHLRKWALLLKAMRRDDALAKGNT